MCKDRYLPRNTMLASGSSIWYPNEVVVSCVRVLASNSTPTWIWRTNAPNILTLILNVFLKAKQQSLSSLPACWLGDNSWHGHLLFQHLVWLPSLVLERERQGDLNKKNQTCKYIDHSQMLTWVLSSQSENSSFLCSAPMVNQLPS